MPINYKLYPPNWKKEIVPAIRQRSGNRCEECGVCNGATVMSITAKKVRKFKTVYRKVWHKSWTSELPPGAKLVKVVLTVAHLDNDAHNHSVDLARLKHLCQRCHLKADAYYKAIKRKCGYYCDSPLCSNISCIHKTKQPCH